MTLQPSGPALAATLQDGLQEPQRTLGFLAVAMVLFVSVLDVAIANVALPPIAHEFGIDPLDAVWIVNAYQLTVTMLLVPISSLGDIVGARRLYLIGVALFVLASLACALSNSLGTLIAARILQGLGAATVMGLNISLLRAIYPHAMLGRAAGNAALVIGVSSAAGPAVAGAILAFAPWQALFLVNVPIGMVALAVGYWTLPVMPPAARRFDFKSAILIAAMFGLVITGLNLLGHPDRAALAWTEIAVGVLIAVVLVRYELRRAVPMLPVDLLAKPIFALTALSSLCSFSAQSLAFVSLPFMLHDQFGRSISDTALLIAPWPACGAAAAFVSGRIADRVTPGRLAAVGLSIFAVGLLLLALMPATGSDLDLSLRMAVAGLGFGVFQAPNNRILLSSAPRERSGGANAIQSTARLFGQSLGVAMLAIILGLVASEPLRVALFLAAFMAAAGVLPSALRRAEPPVRSSV